MRRPDPYEARARELALGKGFEVVTRGDRCTGAYARPHGFVKGKRVVIDDAAEQGISLGTASNIQHTATQRTVPAQIGITFGFRYKVVGRPAGSTVDLKKIIIFPLPGLQTATSSNPLTRAEFEVEAKIGETNSELYTLEDNFELVPGTWVLEMWHGSRKLISQSFKLDKQAEKAEGEKPERPKAEKQKPAKAKPDTGKPDTGKPDSGDGL